MPRNVSEPFLLETAVDFLEPLAVWKSPYTVSRLAILPDRSTKPVLQILAERKFGSWNAEDFFPFWIDGDPTHELLQNVALAPRTKTPHRSLGLPGGPDYRKRWRAANKSRVRRYAREAQERRALREKLS